MAVCSDIDPSPSLAGLHHLGIAVLLCFILEAGRHRDGSTALTGAIVGQVHARLVRRVDRNRYEKTSKLTLIGGTLT